MFSGDGTGGHQRINPRHQKDTGGHHGSRMDQRADGSGAFHGVGQPHMQRHLTGFANGAQKDQ